MSSPCSENGSSGRAKTIGVLAVLLVLALLPRVVDLGYELGIDDVSWLRFSTEFVKALKSGRFGDTHRGPHPGVTVMALSGLSDAGYVAATLASEGKGASALSAEDKTYVGFVRRFPLAFVFSKLPLALLGVACVLAIFLLLRKLVSFNAAALAGGMLALEPFIIAHSRLIATDATFAVLTTCSLLAFVCFLKTRSRRYLLVSAVLAGLSILTRSAGIVLFPVCAVLYLGAQVVERGHWWKSLGSSLYSGGRAAIVYLVVTAVVFTAFFPAMWVAPVKTLNDIFGKVLTNIENESPNVDREAYSDFDFPTWPVYFKGAVVKDPGLTYYPSVMLWRSSPVVLFLASVAVLHLVFLRRRMEPGAKLVVASMVIYGVTYIAGMSLITWKQNRYFLPALMSLDIMAGVELAALLQVLASFLFGPFRAGRALVIPGVLLALVVGQSYPLLQLHPNYLSYFNPVFYNPQKVWEDFSVASGEGLHEAAQYLNGKPGAPGLVVASAQERKFSPFFVGQTIDLEAFRAGQRADYVVIYALEIQNRRIPEVTDAFYLVKTPERVVNINGINYSWIYKLH